MTWTPGIDFYMQRAFPVNRIRSTNVDHNSAPGQGHQDGRTYALYVHPLEVHYVLLNPAYVVLTSFAIFRPS